MTNKQTWAQSAAGKRVILGVCGGIAAYKVVEVARELTQAGADVHVLMTRSATQFVGPITFSTLTGNPVESKLFPGVPPTRIAHTELGRSADLILVAPATANMIARVANGLAHDVVSATVLASKAPVLMAPAMHTEMWENEATKANVKTLTARGIRFVPPESGPLAGPDVGVGRLADPIRILEAIGAELDATEDFAGVGLLVTAGGTREPIDAVRFIGNRSSGKMGYAIADEAARRGGKVKLVTASDLATPAGVESFEVKTASEMAEVVRENAEGCRVIIMAAAVADWRPVHAEDKKLKKRDGAPEIDLEPTGDILAELGSEKGDRILVGFAAESSYLAEEARRKLVEKNLDMIIANDISAEDSGFEVETNRAVILDRLGGEDELPLMSKRELARQILDAVSERFL